jgi:hypothetical protein
MLSVFRGKELLALIPINIGLEGVRRFMISHQAELSATLTVIQILVGLGTLALIIRKLVTKKPPTE